MKPIKTQYIIEVDVDDLAKSVKIAHEGGDWSRGAWFCVYVLSCGGFYATTYQVQVIENPLDPDEMSHKSDMRFICMKPEIWECIESAVAVYAELKEASDESGKNS